jgi:hypothetical protein
MRQDELLKLRDLQLRRNRLPALSWPSGSPKKRTLPDSLTSAENPGQRRLTAAFGGLQKPATRLGKQVIGDGLRSRIDESRVTEVGVAVHVLNRMLALGRPNYVRVV